MKEITVRHCNKCPFFHEDYSGISHRAECWLDIDIMTSMDIIPTLCPLRHESEFQIKLILESHDKYEG